MEGIMNFVLRNHILSTLILLKFIAFEKKAEQKADQNCSFTIIRRRKLYLLPLFQKYPNEFKNLVVMFAEYQIGSIVLRKLFSFGVNCGVISFCYPLSKFIYRF